MAEAQSAPSSDAAPGNPGAAATQADQQPTPEGLQEPADNDAIYAEAFAQFLSNEPAGPNDSEAPNGQATAPPDQDEQTDPAGDEPPAVQLTDEQKHLLNRLHMTPDMIAGWTPEQRQAFLENAAKREADNTRTYQELRDRLQRLERDQQQAREGQPPQGTPPAEAPAQKGTLEAEAAQFAEQLLDDYGEQIKPLTDSHVKLARTVDQLTARLESETQASALKDRLLVEMTIDAGIRDLVNEFPSLSKAEARQKVEERFKNSWADSPHAKGDGPLLSRIRAAIHDAAKAEFGSTTESAAQAALVNKTKDRLKNQPPTGQGKSHKRPATEDDVYAEAFEEYLAPEFRR